MAQRNSIRELNQLDASLIQVSRSAKQVESNLDKIQKRVTSLNTHLIEKLSTSMLTLNQHSAKVVSSFEAFGKQMLRQKGSLAKTVRSVERLKLAYRQAHEEANKFTESIQKSEQSTSGKERKASKGMSLESIKDLSQKVSDATLPQLKGIAQSGADFEERLNRIKARSQGMTDEDIQSIHQGIMRHTGNSKLSALEWADIVDEMAIAQMNEQQINASYQQIEQLIRAKQADPKEAVHAVVMSIKSMDATHDELSRYAEIIAATSPRLQLKQMMKSLHKVSKSASEYGTPLEEIVSVLSISAEHGVSSDDAGKAYQHFYQQLTLLNGHADGKLLDRQSRLALKELEGLKIKLKDEKGNRLPILEVAKNINQMFMEKTDAEREAYIRVLFGKEAENNKFGKNFLGHLDKIQQLQQDLSSKEIRQATIASRLTFGTNDAVVKMNNAIESLKVTLGGLLLPMITQLSNVIRDKVVALRQWVKENPKLAATLLKVGSAVVIIATVALTLIGIIGILGTAMKVAGAAFAAISGGALLAASGVIALIAVLSKLIYDNFEWLKNFAGGIWDGFMETIQPTLDALQPLFDLFNMIWACIKVLGQEIGELLAPFLNWVGELERATHIGKTLGKIFGHLVSSIVFPFQKIAIAFRFVKGLIGDGLAQAGNQELPMFARVLNALSDGIQPTLESLRPLFDFFQLLWNAIKEIAKEFSKLFGPVKSWVSELASTLNIGKLIGKVFGHAFNLIAAPIKLLVMGGRKISEFFGYVADKLGQGKVKQKSKYFETLQHHQSVKSGPEAQTNIPQTVSQLPTAQPPVSIEKVAIEIKATEGMDQQSIADKVKSAMEDLIREQHASQRGALYDY